MRLTSRALPCGGTPARSGLREVALVPLCLLMPVGRARAKKEMKCRNNIRVLFWLCWIVGLGKKWYYVLLWLALCLKTHANENMRMPFRGESIEAEEVSLMPTTRIQHPFLSVVSDLNIEAPRSDKKNDRCSDCRRGLVPYVISSSVRTRALSYSISGLPILSSHRAYKSDLCKKPHRSESVPKFGLCSP